MNNLVHPQQVQLPIDEITSPLGVQFEFSESELFPEALQNNSEVGSINSSNNCYHDQEDSSYNPTNHSIPMDEMNNSNYNSTATPPQATAAISSAPTTGILRHHHHPIFFEDDRLENDISASLHFMPSPPSFSQPHNGEYLSNTNNNNYGQEVLFSTFNDDIGISLGEPNGQPGIYKEEGNGFFSCVSHHLPPSYNVRLMSDAPSALGDHMNVNAEPYFPLSRLNGPFSFGGPGIMGGNMFLGGDHLELEMEGDNIMGSMARVFNCSTGDLQGSPTTTLASDISCSLEDPNFKVPKLSPEERKRKILRYLKKRNERNFSKKIKYACRKTLADSRPRVRGRFARNDELAEMARNKLGDHDTDEDAAAALFSNPNIVHHQHKVVKGEEMLESDIFGEMNGSVNSFKCDYPIQSWI